MYAALRETNLVLCFMLVQILLLRLANATLSSIEEEITDESTTTDLNVLTSTEQQFMSATISLEATTSKAFTTTSRDQIMSSTNTPTAGPTTISPMISTETATNYEPFTTTTFDQVLGENVGTSSSNIEGSRYEVRNIKTILNHS